MPSKFLAKLSQFIKKIPLSITPQDSNFFNYLKQATTNLVEGSKKLNEFILNLSKSKSLEFPDKLAQDYLDQIHQIEKRGDEITHLIFNKLYTTFVPPLDKDDIKSLAEGIDDILDRIYLVAKRIVFYRCYPLRPPVIQLSHLILKASKKINKAIACLPHVDELQNFVIQLKSIETEADEIAHKRVALLFKDHDPLDLIKWKDLYQALEDTTDKAEDLAKTIEGVVIKYG